MLGFDTQAELDAFLRDRGVSKGIRVEATPEADAMLAMVGKEGAIVPSLWHLEIANGLGMAERRNRLSQTAVTEAITLLRGLASRYR